LREKREKKNGSDHRALKNYTANRVGGWGLPRARLKPRWSLFTEWTSGVQAPRGVKATLRRLELDMLHSLPCGNSHACFWRALPWLRRPLISTLEP
jgi:hypothetical protein